ncbi:MAG TPA: hypothetical protein DCP31_31915 [Cyanobacteria bacterium UBA8543]|nr:hypothetical protein [Cyanobacteria bacterium UBA8543]
MRNWPTWIPNPTAWMSAILLILLFRGISVVIRIIFEMGELLMAISLKLKILLYFVALLSPILAIALAHHLLHLFLDRYAPNSRSPGMSATEGLFPSLMSWWEGFYGWMAISLAMLVSSMIQFIFLPSPSFNSLYNLLAWWDELRDLFTLPTLYRVVAAAYLYQFEYLVRHHLMAIGSGTQSERE